MHKRQPARTTESVWDYPRPPRIEPLLARARVEFDGEKIADSMSALRVLETSHPPTIYFPRRDVRMDLLRPAAGSSVCEWKGLASYFDVLSPKRMSSNAAWTYNDPRADYRALAGHIASVALRAESSKGRDRRANRSEDEIANIDQCRQMIWHCRCLTVIGPCVS